MNGQNACQKLSATIFTLRTNDLAENAKTAFPDYHQTVAKPV